MEAENSARSEFGPIFADYLISCWCFRLRPIDDETSAVYVDHFTRPPELVASTLAEFLATSRVIRRLLMRGESLT